MAADVTYQGTGLQRRQDGTTALPSGGSFDIEAGAALKIAGTEVTASAAELNIMDGVTATTTELNQYCVNAYQADAGTAGSVFVVCPFAGAIKKLSVVGYAKDTTTKTTFTAEIAGTLVTAPAWELALNAEAGTVSSVVPTAANVVTAGQALELISDGATDATLPVMYTVTIER
jgi:hypothetical protein